jgi:predicted NAD/FAD-binding protein
MSDKLRVAIVGAGISGISCAYALRKESNLDISLFEKGSYIGGHSNTIDMTPFNSKQTFPIDTGFLVFNEWTYPGIIAFFKELEVPVAKSEMSFSVSIPNKNRGRLEWAGDNLNTIFAQRKNLFNPRFLSMVKDILRFNRLGKRIAAEEAITSPDQVLESVAEFLDRLKFSRAFRDWYLLPMIGAIWSCSLTEMLNFPIQTLMRFCNNHGLLNVLNRPQWLTIKGGSKEYVQRAVNALKDDGIKIRQEQVLSCVRSPSAKSQQIQLRLINGEVVTFDKVVFACHSDEALEILSEPSVQEKEILSAVAYTKNLAYVHEDRQLLPHLPLVWAAWNYTSGNVSPNGLDQSSGVCVHYLINKLQPIPVHASDTPIVVSLNPQILPAPEKIHSVIEYSHPVFNQAAIIAQQKLPSIQGLNHTYFCGAWTKYGFHEDGFQSGQFVAKELIKSLLTI